MYRGLLQKLFFRVAPLCSCLSSGQHAADRWPRLAPGHPILARRWGGRLCGQRESLTRQPRCQEQTVYDRVAQRVGGKSRVSVPMSGGFFFWFIFLYFIVFLSLLRPSRRTKMRRRDVHRVHRGERAARECGETHRRARQGSIAVLFRRAPGQIEMQPGARRG